MPDNTNRKVNTIFNTTVLMPWADGLYIVAKPDDENMQLGPVGEYVLPEDVVPFGFQKDLRYIHYQTEAGFLRKEYSPDYVRHLCFNDMLSELESMVSGRKADAVLVEITTDRFEDSKWMLGGHAQLLMYKKE